MVRLEPTTDLGEHQIQTHAKCASLPLWSFGTATRFKWATKAEKRPPRSLSVPASPQKSTQLGSDRVGSKEARHEEHEEEEEEEEAEDEEPRVEFPRDRATWCGSWDIGGHVTRLDGSSDRNADHPQRVSAPRPKQYEPAVAMGEDTSLSMVKAPMYSFGGGKSRCPQEKRVLPTTGRPIPKVSKGPMLPEGPMQRELAKFKAMTKGPSRGFGSEMRLPARGGALQLGTSPGPAAYDVPRDHDLQPQWAASTLTPWGKRTGERPACLNPSNTDAGPGEYTAHHQMQAYRPSCKFGQPLQELRKDETPEPGRYPIPTSVGVAPAWSMNAGGRTSIVPKNDNPGPGNYNADINAVQANSYCATFGKSLRAHPCDDIDPDEPPGPGAHQVRVEPRAEDKPSTAWPLEEKLKKPSGMGPETPGPAYHLPSRLSTRATSLGPRFERKREELPGPFHYHPQDSLTTHSPPHWGSPSRTAPRRGFWETGGAGDSAKGSKLKPAPIDFKPEGARWTMAPRRPLPHAGGGAKHPRDNHDALYGAFYSLKKP